MLPRLTRLSTSLSRLTRIGDVSLKVFWAPRQTHARASTKSKSDGSLSNAGSFGTSHKAKVTNKSVLVLCTSRTCRCCPQPLCVRLPSLSSCEFGGQGLSQKRHCGRQDRLSSLTHEEHMIVRTDATKSCHCWPLSIVFQSLSPPRHT